MPEDSAMLHFLWYTIIHKKCADTFQSKYSKCTGSGTTRTPSSRRPRASRPSSAYSATNRHYSPAQGNHQTCPPWIIGSSRARGSGTRHTLTYWGQSDVTRDRKTPNGGQTPNYSVGQKVRLSTKDIWVMTRQRWTLLLPRPLRLQLTQLCHIPNHLRTDHLSLHCLNSSLPSLPCLASFLEGLPGHFI